MPVAVDLDDYVTAGYLIARPVVRPVGSDPAYVTDPVVSCSGWYLRDGVGPLAPRDPSFATRAGDLGVSQDDVADAHAWVTEHGSQVASTCAWVSPKPLLAFTERFLPPDSTMVLGLALPRRRVQRWDLSCYYGGLYERLAEGRPPEPGGVPLGWEPVEWEPHETLSNWTWNGLQPRVAQDLNLRLTEWGLLTDQAHADEVMRIVRSLPKEEFGEWDAFLLIRYGPEPRGPFREVPLAGCKLTPPTAASLASAGGAGAVRRLLTP